MSVSLAGVAGECSTVAVAELAAEDGGAVDLGNALAGRGDLKSVLASQALDWLSVLLGTGLAAADFVLAGVEVAGSVHAETFFAAPLFAPDFCSTEGGVIIGTVVGSSIDAELGILVFPAEDGGAS